jgi:hypothetical protein
MDDRRSYLGSLTRHPAERSISGLLSDLASQVGLLLRQEVALLKAELRGKAGQLGTGTALVAAGGLVAFAGLLYLLAAAVLGLANILDPWLAALIVGLVVALVGGALVMAGRSRLQAQDLTPRRTIRSLQDGAEWMRGERR